MIAISPPPGWVSQAPRSSKAHNGWLVVASYGTGIDTADGHGPGRQETVDVSVGQIPGLSIADYAYLETEAIKHDSPDVTFEVNREARPCNGNTGWQLAFKRSSDGREHSVLERLYIDDGRIYRAVYSYDSNVPPEHGAVRLLDSLCSTDG